MLGVLEGSLTVGELALGSVGEDSCVEGGEGEEVFGMVSVGGCPEVG